MKWRSKIGGVRGKEKSRNKPSIVNDLRAAKSLISRKGRVGLGKKEKDALETNAISRGKKQGGASFYLHLKSAKSALAARKPKGAKKIGLNKNPLYCILRQGRRVKAAMFHKKGRE